MTVTTSPAPVDLDGPGGNSPFDWRGRIGWAIVDTADWMQRVAHRITRGETPTYETLTAGHIHDVAVMSGIPASSLIMGAEASPASRRIAARVYLEMVRGPVSSERIEAVADALGVDLRDLVLPGEVK